MKGKIVPAIMLTLLLTGMLTLAFNVQQAKASGTIYIRADGSIAPPTAPISTSDNVTYTFTDDINDSIVVERDNIAVDGAGYAVQGPEVIDSKGIMLAGRSNVTVRNMTIKNFYYGIYLAYSSDNTLSGNNVAANNWYGIVLDYSSNNILFGNNVANNTAGIWLKSSSDNTLSGNNVTANYVVGIVLYCSSNNILFRNNVAVNSWFGIVLDYSSNNILFGNNVANNDCGISFYSSSNDNVLFGNNVTANKEAGIEIYSSSNNTLSGNNVTATAGIDIYAYGIYLDYSSDNTLSGNNVTATKGYGIVLYYSNNNVFYHNNFINNIQHVYILTPSYANSWDDGYPSGGNYWSDYDGIDLYSGPQQNETGSDGIGDTPYVIDENNQDNYPLMKPYPWDPHDVGITSVTTSKNIVGQGFNVSINVSVFNYGDSTENFNVTIYANLTTISEINNVELASRNSTTINFTWDTTGFAMGNYTMTVCATPVSGEMDTTDNNSTSSWVLVTIQGDVDGDFENGHYDVDLFDAVKLLAYYGAKIGDSNYDPNCDIDNDGRVFLFDAVMLLGHYGQKYP